MSRFGEDNSVTVKRMISIGLAAVFLLGVFAVLPMGTQNAKGWMSPDAMATITFDDIVLMSGGTAVEDIGPGQYIVHEPIMIMPSDTLMLTGMENVFFDPFMGTSIEIEGFFDANMGMGATFHSAGPGSWQGIRISGNGGMMANGLNIWDAVDGIYADHSFGFGMMQIDGCMILGCQNTGITMIGTMGGPGINMNMIQGCDTGIYLRDTSAQCFNDEVMDCRIGIQVEGDFGPMINQCQIHDNYEHGVYLNGAGTAGVMDCTFRNNFQENICLQDSTGNIMGNHIYAYNATIGSSEPGRDGILVRGTSDWGQTWISQNWIFGGNGDENQDGGSAIVIDNYEGNASNAPQVENIIIDQNNWIQGGKGGDNNFPAGRAGNGGCGIFVNNLSNDNDWLADQQSLVVTNNFFLFGGHGGDNMDPMGFAGNGGHGAWVFGTGDKWGNVRFQDNGPITGGNGGISMNPLDGGSGGDAMKFEDIYAPGSRVGGNNWVVGGEDGGPILPPFIYGGYGLNLERCKHFDVWLFNGTGKHWFINYSNSHDCDFDDISVNSSNAGGLINVQNSTANGTDWTNWNFTVSDVTKSVFNGANSSNISINLAELKVEYDETIVLLNCSDWNFEDIFIEFNTTFIPDPSMVPPPIFVGDSDDTDFEGLIMEWEDDDVPDSGVDGWVFDYGDDCSNFTISNSSFSGGGLIFNNSQNVNIIKTNVTVKNGTAVRIVAGDNTTVFNSELSSFLVYNGTEPPKSPPGFDEWFSNNTKVKNTTVKTKNTKAVNANNCNNTFIGDSFFDVEYNITFPDAPTGVLIENATNTIIQNSTVTVKNGSAVKNKNSNDSWMVDSFFDVYYDVNFTGPKNSSIIFNNSSNSKIDKCDINTFNGTGISVIDCQWVFVENSTVKNGTGGIDIVNSTATLKNNTVNNTGTYGARCTVTDADGDESSDTVTIVIEKNKVTNTSKGIQVTLNRSATDSKIDLNVTDNDIINCSIGFNLWNPYEFSSPHPDDMSVLDNRLRECGIGVCITGSTGTCIAPSGINPNYKVCGNKFTANGIGFKHEGVASSHGECVSDDRCLCLGNGSNEFTGNTQYGIYIINATNFIVGPNIVKDSIGVGIHIENSMGFIIRNGTYENNNVGITLVNCTNATIYHNNFIGNTIQALDDGSTILWDNGYPSGGNYWSDYGGIDMMSGALQDQPGSDEIGDTPYIIDADSMDRYPYMDPIVIVEHKQELLAGWNLLSLPMHQFNNSLEEALTSIDGKWDKVTVYDTTAPEPWLSTATYRPDTLNDDITIDRTVGVWVRTTEACTFTSYGISVASTDITLYAGWNLIGYPSYTPMSVAAALAGTGYDRVEAFDPGSPYLISQLNGADLMEPGNGYWVHVPADTTWTVNW